MKELDDEQIARDDLSYSSDFNENVSPSDFVQLERFVDDIHGGIVMSSSQVATGQSDVSSSCNNQSDASSFCNSQSEGCEIRHRCSDHKTCEK